MSMTKETFSSRKRSIALPVLVAEIGLNHNGDLDIARAAISLAKAMGCDYVKFQKRTIEKVYKPEYLQQQRLSQWGKTVEDEKRGLEFGQAQYEEIDAYCKSINMQWFASAWDPESVDFLVPFNLPFIKVAAACAVNEPLLAKLDAVRTPLIVSAGFLSDIEVTDVCLRFGSRLRYVLHSVALYPCAASELRMGRLARLKGIVAPALVGFSNHTDNPLHAVIACALGVKMIEFHFTLDRKMKGADHAASLASREVLQLKDALRETALALSEDTDRPTPEEWAKLGNYLWQEEAR